MASSRHSSLRIGFVTILRHSHSATLLILIQQKCQLDNRTVAEEKQAVEKRKQAQEEMKVNRAKAREAASAQDLEDTAALDNLLEKLRNGDSVGRRMRRGRTGAAARTPEPLTVSTEGSINGGGTDTADIARDMLAQLKSGGFETFVPTSPTISAALAPTTRRRRLRCICSATAYLRWHLFRMYY